MKRAEWRRWYGLKAWRDRRSHQLEEHPLCRFCEAIGIVTEATVADHIKPHRGDADLFFDGALQSLCKQCHDSVKQREESGGEVTIFGADGYPIDHR